MACTTVMNPEFIKILRCLETGSELELADDALRDRVNSAIESRQLRNRLEQRVTRKMDCGLVNAERTILYAVYDGIPQMIAGEAIRPHPRTCIGVELPFQLLQSYQAVETDPELRPTPGFLTAEGWAEALSRAGFTEIELAPDAASLRELWDGAIAAAVCGQRPR